MRPVILAFDDTDSRDMGGCTTYLAFEALLVLKELGYTPYGFPRLVRLNPTVPFKTRGNGAVAIQAFKGEFNDQMRIAGMGQPSEDGEAIGAVPWGCQPDKSEEPDLEELVEKFSRRVDDLLMLDDVDTNPGIAAMVKAPDPTWYRKGLDEVIEIDQARDALEYLGAKTRGYKKGRGLVGALCSAAWEPDRRTYEMITYRQKEKWGKPRSVEKQSVIDMSKAGLWTFDDIDEKNNDVKIVPHSPCPVLTGIRGTEPDTLYQSGAMIKYGERPYRWTLFETNQGTDDHIVGWTPLELVKPYASFLVQGTIGTFPRIIQGGHVIVELFDDPEAESTIDLAAYEPTKGFRDVVRQLVPGDKVAVCGAMRPDPLTMNIEKIKVLKLANVSQKVANPKCPECQASMSSVGKGQGYRCKRCGTKATENDATFERMERDLKLGWYEVDPIARRHLSRPISLGTEHLDSRL